MKKEIPDKIQWNGYKQQLNELFDLLVIKDYIPYDRDRFISHFSDKSKRPYKHDKRKKGLIEWKNEHGKYLIIILIDFLIENRFMFDSYKLIKNKIVSKHFKGINLKSIRQQAQKNRTTKKSKQLNKDLFKLFPKNTGEYHDRNFYKLRNKHPEYSTLSYLGFDITRLNVQQPTTPTIQSNKNIR